MATYPRWRYFPSWAVPPAWVAPVAAVFAAHQTDIDSAVEHAKRMESNDVLGVVAHGLRAKEPSYAKTYSVVEAIYASPRLQLPFEGLLLVGY